MAAVMIMPGPGGTGVPAFPSTRRHAPRAMPPRAFTGPAEPPTCAGASPSS